MPSSRGLEGVISLFGFRGLATAPITKSSGDSGSGTESSEVHQAIVGSDVGEGVEGTPTIALSSLRSDVGVGMEGESVLAAALSGSDAGSGAEASSLSAQVVPSDVGLGVESSSLTVHISSSDAGVGVDTSALALDRMIIVEITSIEPFRTIEYT